MQNAGFPEPALAANVCFADSIVCKNKSFVWKAKDAAKKKTPFLHMLFVENERETSKQKKWAIFFNKVQGHMQK